MRMESILQEFNHKLNYWTNWNFDGDARWKVLGSQMFGFFLIITEWAHEWVFQIVFMAIYPIWGDIQL